MTATLLQLAQAAQLANRYSLIRRENQAKTIRKATAAAT
jgi:hypothetical protein